jgi:hypothetical protein
MTWGGWLVMGISVGSVVGLFVWCIWRVLREPGETDHLHGFEGTPPDRET